MVIEREARSPDLTGDPWSARPRIDAPEEIASVRAAFVVRRFRRSRNQPRAHACRLMRSVSR
jgi:hypothetical protein